MIRFFTFSIILLFIFVYACNNPPPLKSINNSYHQDTASCSKGPVKDPNHPKPMALAMRAMVMNTDSIRAQLLRGENPDSSAYPFIRFYMVEPTDPAVLEPRFYENARLFHQAYKEFFRHGNEGVKYYNSMVGNCVNCHQSYCSGPLKRIKKLFIGI